MSLKYSFLCLTKSHQLFCFAIFEFWINTWLFCFLVHYHQCNQNRSPKKTFNTLHELQKHGTYHFYFIFPSITLLLIKKLTFFIYLIFFKYFGFKKKCIQVYIIAFCNFWILKIIQVFEEIKHKYPGCSPYDLACLISSKWSMLTDSERKVYYFNFDYKQFNSVLIRLLLSWY